ncbi:hypothetical protein UNSW1_1419 [Campylobacter concisus UNSW1]|uniref:hypothetical protein n=1 Tax=Campylobacter concisus TaxID=199 RepID=UPI00039894EE|nr:hypothetical protein [Campylobacter concisus]ERJ24580.1 hypothetical protein UNSW1_1419 [Campylobacter concisus UNSW1]
MSEKSSVSNFTPADDEVLAFLSNLGRKWHKSDDVANFIERNFTFVGSKPLLRNLKDYKTADYKNFADIKKFLSSHIDIQSKILSSEIGYIGDGLTSVELKFAPEYFYNFLKFMVENVQQHHYFCSQKEGWILLVAMEGYVEFGVLDKQTF